MFEFLFKYRSVAFQKGDLVLGLPAPWLLLGLLLAAGLAWWLSRAAPGERRDRLILTGLRGVALALLVFCLFRPALLVSTVVPHRNFVGVLLDDSRSMRIADLAGETRAARVLGAFGMEGETTGRAGGEVAGEASGAAGVGDPRETADAGQAGGGGEDAGAAASVGGEAGAGGRTGPVRRALEERFRVRFFRFSDLPRRVTGPGELAFLGERTNLAAALEGARQELAGLPLAGLILVSDGAHNGEEAPAEAVLSLRSAGVPVYAVGVGRREVAPDLEVQRVEVPSRALRGSTVLADVVLGHRGLGGRRVRLDVEDGGRIVASTEVQLDGGRTATAAQVQFTAGEAGPRRLAFRARPLDGEALEGNNAREVLLDVRSERRKILYFEGEPRYEIKFLRRAVAADPEIQLVTLLRSAEEKFLRLDVDDPEELAAGFPETREELFAYDGLVLGDVEASFFTGDQLRMIGEFVDRRGGGLIALGGRRALAEGGYAGTPLADALPIRLPEAAAGSDGPGVVSLSPELTPAGRRHPAVRLAEGEEASRERWSGLPPVTTVNRVGEVKPGAVTLLGGTGEDGDRRPLLSYQRFGRGLAVAFPVQDTWQWQMGAQVPLEDESHETLWRQLLRWLVSGVPGRVQVQVAGERVPPDGTALLRAEVDDERYLRLNRASVVARVIGPTGLETELPMDWTVIRDGEYAARFQPTQEGLHTVRVEATGPEGGVAVGSGHFDVAPVQVEHFEAGMNAPLLEQIARETGGRFYEMEDLSALPEDIVYTESGEARMERMPLWDMPALFLLLVGLIGAEWGYRRWRGLA